MSKTFDPTKPVQTRDGRKARIVDTNYRHLDKYPIPAIIIDREGRENTISCAACGRFWIGEENDKDLVNIPVKHERWINIYPEDVRSERISHHLFPSKEKAEAEAGGKVITTLKIEWEE